MYIDIIDFKDNWFTLSPTGKQTTSEKGLVEWWWYITEGTGAETPFSSYGAIPLPIFTEWFI